MITLSVTVGALVAGGAAYAASSASTITACATSGAQDLHLASKGKCAKGEKKVAWNAKGQTGAAGVAGKNGTNGTNGLNGTNGTNGVAGKDGAAAGYSYNLDSAVAPAAMRTVSGASAGGVTLAKSSVLPAGKYLVNATATVNYGATGTAGTITCQLVGAGSANIIMQQVAVNEPTASSGASVALSGSITFPAADNFVGVICSVPDGGTGASASGSGSLTAVQVTTLTQSTSLS